MINLKQMKRLDAAEHLTVAVISQKGGVGKTTTTVNIAYELARLGVRVLCIDTDPTAGLTKRLLAEQVTDRHWKLPDTDPTLSHVISPRTEVTLEHAIYPALQRWQPRHDLSWMRGGALRPGGSIDVVPCDGSLAQADADSELQGVGLRVALSDFEIAHPGSYDVILVDSQPTGDAGLRLAVAACSMAVLVTEADPMSQDTLPRTLAYIERVETLVNSPRNIAGLIVNKFDRTVRDQHAGLVAADEWTDEALGSLDAPGYEYVGRRWGVPIPDYVLIKSAVSSEGRPVSSLLGQSGVSTDRRKQARRVAAMYATYAINLIALIDESRAPEIRQDLLAAIMPDEMRESLLERSPFLAADSPRVAVDSSNNEEVGES